MDDITEYIGKNLKNLRKARGLSLDKASELTEVSKAMLAQIERGDSVPTVTTLWKIANGLKISFSSLINQRVRKIQVIKKSEMNMITDENNHYRVMTVVPFTPEKQFEVFSVELDPHTEQISSSHNPGVEEHIFVKKGELEIDINGTIETISKDEAIVFEGDQPHIYRNTKDDFLQLMVLIYYAN